MANFEQDFEKKLEAAGYSVWMKDAAWNDASPENCTQVTVYDLSCVGIFKEMKLPKRKLVTVSWILDKWQKAENRESMGPVLKAAIDKAGILPKNSIDVYSTTYGIGVFVLFGEPVKTHRKIKEWLTKNDIAWERDYSPAGWVFRFKISKSQENIEKIKAL